MVVKSIALTGAHGFLGWHTRCAAHSMGLQSRPIRVGDSFTDVGASEAISGSERLIHIAGVNRAGPGEVRDGNVQFAAQVVEGLRKAEQPPPIVVFANSVQAGNGSEYGDAKARASEMLRRGAEAVGAEFVDVRLPNLFGEHGRAFYNSVVATFCHQLVHDQPPTVEEDRELSLLHAQNAAELLLGKSDVRNIEERTEHVSVSGVLRRLEGVSDCYAQGEIPDVSTPFNRDLFNTYRAASFDVRPSILLTRRADARGSFFEIVRSRGGEGQSSFSTTVPGVTRGNHYHRRKIERFTVLAGEAVISLRKLFKSESLELHVSGESPVAVDIPTMWAHNITNVGRAELFTSFWSNERFDPERADTIPEAI